jgi:hypothetical protein
MINDNSPKVYMITKDGKFYNSKDEYFYSNIVNANYEKNKKKLEIFMALNPVFFENCTVFETTENKLFEAFCNETTKTVLAGSYFADHLKNLDYKLPTISQVSKNMHKKMIIAIEELRPISSQFIQFLKKEEERTDDVMGIYGEFIQNVSRIQIFDMKEFNVVFEAFKKDKKSILGIAKKIK